MGEGPLGYYPWKEIPQIYYYYLLFNFFWKTGRIHEIVRSPWLVGGILLGTKVLHEVMWILMVLDGWEVTRKYNGKTLMIFDMQEVTRKYNSKISNDFWRARSDKKNTMAKFEMIFDVQEVTRKIHCKAFDVLQIQHKKQLQLQQIWRIEAKVWKILSFAWILLLEIQTNCKKIVFGIKKSVELSMCSHCQI
jgi:hypothetical protein